MFRRAFLTVLMLAGICREAFAATPLELWIDPDGTTYLYNTTGAPISFDGYQIASETNRLDPVGWKSIADYVAAGQISEVIAALGPGALTFGEANPGAGNLAELNVSGVATLQAGAKFSIGKPFLDGGAACPDPTADFFYKVGGNPNSTPGGGIGGSCPEPSTWLLATLAGFGSLVLRRRPCPKPARPNAPVAQPPAGRPDA